MADLVLKKEDEPEARSSLQVEKVAVKILVLGQANVGKTSLIERFINNKYTNDRRATIGVDFSSKSIEVTENLICVLQLWDTAGQERFNTGTLTSTFFRNADGVVLVYDVSCQESVEQLQQWKRALKPMVEKREKEKAEKQFHVDFLTQLCDANWNLFNTAIKI